MSLHLYEIIPALKKLEEIAEVSEEDMTEYLDGVQLQLNDKVNGIVKYQKNMEANAEAVRHEITRLTKLMGIYSNTAKRLKNYMSNELQNNGIEKLETDIAKLYFLESETLVVTDEKIIPKEFIKVKEVRSVDKIGIKKALKDGRKIDGVMIQENKNLQIK